MKILTQGIVLILQGFGIAIVAWLIGVLIQAIVNIDDFQRGVLTGFVSSIIFYLFIISDKKKPSE